MLPRPISRLVYSRDMKLLRMDHASAVVDDLEAAIDFFTELGMELEGRAPIEGTWADRVNGMEGLKLEIAMLRTPDGHNRLELTKFQAPASVKPHPGPSTPNALGLRSVMFAVDDIDDAVGRLQNHGAELIGEIVQYESQYRLCYLRGPGEMIVALAEELN